MDDKIQPTEAVVTSQNATEGETITTLIKPQHRKLHDSNVTFEEYHYYAQKTRREEDSCSENPTQGWRSVISWGRSSNRPSAQDEAVVQTGPVISAKTSTTKVQTKFDISDKEWTNASRAFRTASWGACFYLITTDILGPFGVAYSLGTLGWGPGIALYTVFGFLAGYSGYLVWRVFLGVDSYEFPARNYGDLGFRTWGRTARHITNFAQALAVLLILGQITIQYGQNISSVSRYRLCYVVCPVLFVCTGFCLSQIRTLKAYGLVANLAVWLNMLVIFISMGVIANSPPNYKIAVLGSAGSAVDPSTITPDAAGNYPSVMHYGGLPSNSLVGSINGLLSGVLAYAGVQLFVEFLAEMRRPRDFLKAMWGAQMFIYTVYLVYGCFIYHFQGQYSFYPSYQGVSAYGWQTAGNMLSLLAALICAGLYGNIGVKVFYNSVLADAFNLPSLTSKMGKILYAAIVPVWWMIAFIIAAAIPDFGGFVSVISASLLLTLTYTMPPLFALGYDMQRNAIRPSIGEGFDVNTGRVLRNETTVQRLVRGYFSGGYLQVAINIWHTIYALASLSMCGLGMYAAVQGLIDAFEIHQLNAFSCKSPLNLDA
ncbi:hypothetical protein A1O3_08980 [Capronia epimyces CBS 606.96]|uniref:Amino acid transporter transmembrane domain-containing protein n=1 Tax=Capronia epimyces CBS 606.96 TaxID=1182542 RepID=W9XLG9_9EURO|nr:uncharacterized protein A1O3_08980 [Capronia epimyces CBS 606.96]EXJ77821.1 hypothetical protein A1O3_08980 [Capronia epimyces CBS 606.96]